MRTLLFLACLTASAPAHANDDELGVPLPGPSAEPALGFVGVAMGLDGHVVPDPPNIDLGNGVTAPRRPASFAGFSVIEYIGGRAYGGFPFWTLGATVTFQVAGAGRADFTAGGARYTNGSIHMWTIDLPAPGYGIRRRTWIATAQIAPHIELFAQDFDTGTMHVGGSDHDLAIGAPLQACKQWNLGGVFSKNGATCVYVEPMLYRGGDWLAGATFGVRWYAL